MAMGDFLISMAKNGKGVIVETHSDHIINRIVKRIMEISEKSFTDPDLSIATLAEKLGYNAKYLSHVFREKAGVRYSEYLRSLRIKYAVSLFDHGIDSVKNVAVLSGFSDAMYFSTVFKESVGVSPKEYRMTLFNKE